MQTSPLYYTPWSLEATVCLLLSGFSYTGGNTLTAHKINQTVLPDGKHDSNQYTFPCDEDKAGIVFQSIRVIVYFMQTLSRRSYKNYSNVCKCSMLNLCTQISHLTSRQRDLTCALQQRATSVLLCISTDNSVDNLLNLQIQMGDFIWFNQLPATSSNHLS